MKKRVALISVILLAIAVLAAVCWFFVSYRRPYREIVEHSGLESSLVYAVMKAESDFREDAVSRSGAVGLMQLMPSTAEFLCRRRGIAFEPQRLFEGAYNAELGCDYLRYLTERFGEEETALAAYNAGEGTVCEWLKDGSLSADGIALDRIPYPETAAYLKKVIKFRKIYRFFYH